MQYKQYYLNEVNPAKLSCLSDQESDKSLHQLRRHSIRLRLIASTSTSFVINLGTKQSAAANTLVSMLLLYSNVFDQ